MVKIILTVLLSLVLLIASAQDDEKVLRELLFKFLDNVESKDMHDRFWAEDLIYTSSSGMRFGKITIIEGFDNENTEAGPEYSAEDIEVKILNEDVAVVAFKLIGSAPDGIKSEYLNSGTFMKRNDQWKAISWQATKIPGK
ncbi:MAG TPA: nuclear transport factor 2 family protein [Cyclobacteriaceae bacterium]